MGSRRAFHQPALRWLSSEPHPQPLPRAYCWHQLLDEAVEVLCEGAVPGTAAQVDGEFPQRKHIPSGITAPKPAQVRQTPGQHCMQVSFSWSIV